MDRNANSKLAIVILAAGKGSRMRSALPKVLQPLGGKPLLGHVLDACTAVDASSVHIVYGHGGESVQAAFDEPSLKWALQADQLGTGHAVQQAMPAIDDNDTVLVLYGDVPLVTTESLQKLADAARQQPTILTVALDDPSGYGRIVRDESGSVTGIVEQKDANTEQQQIREINTGLIGANAAQLKGWLSQLNNDNAQGEYYLTDIVALAVADGLTVGTVCSDDASEVEGINNRLQLAAAERVLQRRLADALMVDGAQIIDPARIDIRGKVSVGADVLIDVGAVFEGDVVLGDNVQIGAYSVIRNATIGSGTVVKPHSVFEDCQVGGDCTIGPFARLRPGAELENGVHIGNFVEVKKSTIADGSKVNHLAYIGDSTIGRGVNVGAGTITCNYDGANKFQTVIEDGAFIGSDTQLVAPVTIGKNATVGAGATITKNVPDGALAITRSPQKHITSWQRPVKQPK